MLSTQEIETREYLTSNPRRIHWDQITLGNFWVFRMFPFGFLKSHNVRCEKWEISRHRPQISNGKDEI